MTELELYGGIAALVVILFVGYGLQRWREGRKAIPPQKKGPTQRHMENDL